MPSVYDSVKVIGNKTMSGSVTSRRQMRASMVTIDAATNSKTYDRLDTLDASNAPKTARNTSVRFESIDMSAIS